MAGGEKARSHEGENSVHFGSSLGKHKCLIIPRAYNPSTTRMDASSRLLKLDFYARQRPLSQSRSTIEKIRRCGIKLLKRPAFSPDLNPIEHVWAWMKNYIQNTYPTTSVCCRIQETSPRSLGCTAKGLHASVSTQNALKINMVLMARGVDAILSNVQGLCC
jgi:hypothetical protein